jgi:hypothetical protein
VTNHLISMKLVGRFWLLARASKRLIGKERKAPN